MKIYSRFWLAGGLILVCAMQTHPQTLTVCEPVNSLPEFNGKMVTVRGWERRVEGSYLVGDNCEHHLVTSGYAWPDAIELHYPDRRANPLEFKEALRSGDLVLNTFKRMGARAGDNFLVTITGIIHTDDDLVPRIVSRLGRRYASGFGAGNWAPAEMEIRGTSNPEIERCRHITPGGK